ncbi:MAG: electron transport complex subunit RsxC [Pseudomonadota bacterium]
MATSLASFRHGVHPTEHKEPTSGLPIQRLGFVERYLLPLSQHLGAPSKPIVVVGQEVARGQRIAEPGGFVSTSLHSPVRGRVVAIEPRRLPTGAIGPAIEIAADSFDPQQPPPPPPGPFEEPDVDELVAGVRDAGIVGLGGAAFPTHVKYKLPDGRRAHTLVINGAECEPWLTCDHRLMLERSRAVAEGIKLVAAALEVGQALVGIEANKLDAVRALQAALRAMPGGPPVQVRPVRVKYPQGGEKMLIEALTGAQVPGGKLPLHIGVVVNNVGTMAALADWFLRGQPLIERVVTVSGPGIARPANLLVPLGTPVRAVLEACGGLPEDARMVIMGGPMMGQPLASVDVPVVKGTSGLLVFREGDLSSPEELACIRCGRCLEACACFLNPSTLGRLARKERWEDMRALNLLDCMECGACSWACPSRIPLVQQFRVAKAQLRRIDALKKQRGGA